MAADEGVRSAVADGRRGGLTAPPAVAPLGGGPGAGFAGPAWSLYARDVDDFRPMRHPVCDLFFADAPYNFGIDYGPGGDKDSLPNERFHAWMRGWLAKAHAAVRPGGALVVLLPDEWAAEAAVYLKRDLGCPQRNWIKWHETFGVQTTKKFARTSRHLLHHVVPHGPFTFDAAAVKVPSARQLKYNDKRAAAGGKVPGDVWEISRVCGTFSERCEAVPTQLPEALLERVVKAWTRAGDLVREFFTGSGSLGRVCVRLGRRYEGWERDGPTAAVALSRIAAAQTVAPP